MKLFTNSFRVLELCQEKAEDGEYIYLKPSDQFSKDYANEQEAIQDVFDRQTKEEKFRKEYVIINVKKFENEVEREE